MSDDKVIAVKLEQHTPNKVILLGLKLVPKGSNEFDYCEELAAEIMDNGQVVTFDPTSRYSFKVTSTVCGSIVVAPFTEGEALSIEDATRLYSNVRAMQYNT